MGWHLALGNLVVAAEVLAAIKVATVATAAKPSGSGSIVEWGFTRDGDWDVSLPNEGFVAIAANQDRSLAIRAQPITAASTVWMIY